MKARRIPWSHAPLTAGNQPLTAETAHYVLRVLRLTDGAPLVLFDGRGKRADGILRIGMDAVTVDISDPKAGDDARPSVTIAAAIPKGERADWLVEKVTELGADAIVWLRCARSVVEPKNIDNKMNRWERVAESAARQCNRDVLPVLRAPLSLQDFVAETTQDLKLIAHPYEARPLHTLVHEHEPEAMRGLRVVIGPEGGLTEDELHAAKTAGYTAWSLNRHILRIETAALAATALLAEVAQR